MAALRLLFGIMIAAIAVALGIFLTDTQNRALLSNGYLTTGKRLGLTIGEGRTAARPVLSRLGYVLEDSQIGGACLSHEYSKDKGIDFFVDHSWRHGLVCVVSSEGRIVAIESETLGWAAP